MIKIQLILFLLCTIIYINCHKFGDDTKKQDTEEAILVQMFKKYDTENRKVLTKEQYQKMLYYLLDVSDEHLTEPQQRLTAKEKKILQGVVDQFIQKKTRKLFTFEDINDDIESGKITQLLHQDNEFLQDLMLKHDYIPGKPEEL